MYTMGCSVMYVPEYFRISSNHINVETSLFSEYVYYVSALQHGYKLHEGSTQFYIKIYENY